MLVNTGLLGAVANEAQLAFALSHEIAHALQAHHWREVRETRGKRALRSPLDDVPGVGPARKKALLKTFGSLTRLRLAQAEQIATVPGIGPELARVVFDSLHDPVTAGRESA